jgi:spermidine synthase
MRAAAIHLLFFGSGATTLVFEILWLRGFAIALGSTLYAMSCVLTAFTLGLALGSALAHRYVKRFETRSAGFFIASYGLLELAIGISGLLLTVALFRGQEDVLNWVVSLAGESLAGTLAGHFSISFAMMLLPTLCMGATLPILCMGLDRDADTSTLYGFNTFGAAADSLIASFVLIYRIGCIRSGAVVAGLNALICLGAIAAARCAASTPSRHTALESASNDPPASANGWSTASVLWLSLFSGYAFFSYELVWNRVLGLILGNRVYVTSVTLFLVLFCLGLGACASRVLRDRVPPRDLLFGSYGIAILAFLAAARALPRRGRARAFCATPNF